MKRKTYNNVLKAGELIQKKGYEEKEALELAVQKFDELASLKNGMSVEWLIDKMATKTESEGESIKLSESDKNYFKNRGYLDQDIPQIERAIEAPHKAAISGWQSWSTLKTVATTATSFL